MESANTISDINDISRDRPKGKLFTRILKYLAFFIIGFITVLFVVHKIWVGSGSGEWELALEKDGVKIFSMKEPGNGLVRYRGITRGNYSLSHLVAAMRDNSAENCAEWIPGCTHYENVVPWNSDTQTATHLWRVELPPIFKAREFLLETKISQDESSKEVLIEFTALPDAKERDECCRRIENMHNSWKYTPIGDGEVEIELSQNLDMGGGFPYFLMNLDGANRTHEFLFVDLPKLLNKEKYRNTRYDFIVE